jgi:hypothetical protein
MNTSTSSVMSHAIVAAAAAILSGAATWGGVNVVSSSMAQQTAQAGAQQLMAQPLLDLPGREVRMTLLDRAPGASSPPHRHPGTTRSDTSLRAAMNLGSMGSLRAR